MPANSSDNPAGELRELKAAVTGETHWRGRLLLLGLNFIPLLLGVSAALLLLLLPANLPARIAASLGWLYLAPPVVARIILMCIRVPEGPIAIGTKPFFAWWASFQLQLIFCRLPALEEVLRLVPGLYSVWLRLWGARIGRFTFWSPGTLITDRSFLAIGDDVVFGAGVRLNAHVLARGPEGKLRLLLANIHVGHRAMVGGYSLLTAGTEISPDEVTRAFLISPPFSKWRDGKRIRDQHSSDFE